MSSTLLVLGLILGDARAGACEADALMLGRAVDGALAHLRERETGYAERFEAEAGRALALAGCAWAPVDPELDGRLHLLWSAWVSSRLVALDGSFALADLFAAFDALEERGLGDAALAELAPEEDYLRAAHGLWRSWRADQPAVPEPERAPLPMLSGCGWRVDGVPADTLPPVDRPALVQLLCVDAPGKSAWRVRPALLPAVALPEGGPPETAIVPAPEPSFRGRKVPWVGVAWTGGTGLGLLTTAAMLRLAYLSGEGEGESLVGWNAATGIGGLALLGTSAALVIPWGGRSRDR